MTYNFTWFKKSEDSFYFVPSEALKTNDLNREYETKITKDGRKVSILKYSPLPATLMPIYGTIEDLELNEAKLRFAQACSLAINNPSEGLLKLSADILRLVADRLNMAEKAAFACASYRLHEVVSFDSKHVCATADDLGLKNILIWAIFERRFPFRDNLKMVLELREEVFKEANIRRIMREGRCHLLKAILERSGVQILIYERWVDILYCALRFNRLGFIDFLVDRYKLFKNSSFLPAVRTVMENAALFGHLDFIQKAHAEGVIVDENVSLGAAEGGHLPILEWLKENGLPISKGAGSRAARKNQVQVIAWLESNVNHDV